MPEERRLVGASAAVPNRAATSAAATTRPTATPRSIYTTTDHPIIKSFEPGEDWGWCYVDEIFFESLAQLGLDRGKA